MRYLGNATGVGVEEVEGIGGDGDDFGSVWGPVRDDGRGAGR